MAFPAHNKSPVAAVGEAKAVGVVLQYDPGFCSCDRIHPVVECSGYTYNIT